MLKRIHTKMQDTQQHHSGISGWDDDYYKLKRMRWIRGRLVHDSDLFGKAPFSEEGIEWLRLFHSRIIQKKPFSLLRQKSINRLKTKTPNERRKYKKSSNNRIFRGLKIAVGTLFLAILVLIILFFVKYL